MVTNEERVDPYPQLSTLQSGRLSQAAPKQTSDEQILETHASIEEEDATDGSDSDGEASDDNLEGYMLAKDVYM